MSYREENLLKASLHNCLFTHTAGAQSGYPKLSSCNGSWNYWSENQKVSLILKFLHGIIRWLKTGRFIYQCQPWRSYSRVHPGGMIEATCIKFHSIWPPLSLASKDYDWFFFVLSEFHQSVENIHNSVLLWMEWV